MLADLPLDVCMHKSAVEARVAVRVVCEACARQTQVIMVKVKRWNRLCVCVCVLCVCVCFVCVLPFRVQVWFVLCSSR